MVYSFPYTVILFTESNEDVLDLINFPRCIVVNDVRSSLTMLSTSLKTVEPRIAKISEQAGVPLKYLVVHNRSGLMSYRVRHPSKGLKLYDLKKEIRRANRYLLIFKTGEAVLLSTSADQDTVSMLYKKADKMGYRKANEVINYFKKHIEDVTWETAKIITPNDDFVF